MLFAEHWAVITPPGRKLPSSEEQANSAWEFVGVSAKRKPAGHACQKKSVQGSGNFSKLNTQNIMHKLQFQLSIASTYASPCS